MARYRGPSVRQSRRAGVPLDEKSERHFAKRGGGRQNRLNPPGMHGDRRQRRPSEHGLQLREKQKVRWMYGVLEKQFRRHFEAASRMEGVTGENLLRILEMRLDNVVYRSGFASTRRQARQLVNHGHIMLNGRKTNIPSAIVKPGDVVSIRPQSREKEYFKVLAEELGHRDVPEWITRNDEEMSVTILQAPTRDQIVLPEVNEQLIVEFYSK
ncbi:MAG TPA: 30S ribosomal protein S4 [Thermomicrobiales bacterium]|nr:30S ribosomal protein S4 [Thermomicrobiales bacterium]